MSMINSPCTGKVLVVDDDERVQILVKALFRRRGVAIECAGDGVRAMERLRRTRYDAVILDLMLPEPNGFDIIREIRSRDRALLDHTIVLTAAADITLRDFADARSVRRVMRKPFNVEELLTEVLSLIPDSVATDSV
jgi:two-component system, OmpR family, response regulator MprA